MSSAVDDGGVNRHLSDDESINQLEVSATSQTCSEQQAQHIVR